jgi:hypothetical protein
MINEYYVYAYLRGDELPYYRTSHKGWGIIYAEDKKATARTEADFKVPAS